MASARTAATTTAKGTPRADGSSGQAVDVRQPIRPPHGKDRSQVKAISAGTGIRRVPFSYDAAKNQVMKPARRQQGYDARAGRRQEGDRKQDGTRRTGDSSAIAPELTGVDMARQRSPELSQDMYQTRPTFSPPIDQRRPERPRSSGSSRFTRTTVAKQGRGSRRGACLTDVPDRGTTARPQEQEPGQGMVRTQATRLPRDR